MDHVRGPYSILFQGTANPVLLVRIQPLRLMCTHLTVSHDAMAQQLRNYHS